MKMNMKKFWLILLMSFTVVTHQNCGDSDGTDTGDPGLRLELEAYSEQTALINYLIPKAYADVSRVAMCVHQIRFFADNNSSTPGENAVIDIDYIEWNSSGTDLGKIDVQPGDYRRIDIMVRNDCDNGASITIQNDNGEFSGTQPMILRFIGETTVGNSGGTLSLSVESFIDFFDTVTSDNDLSAGVRSVSGTF